MSQPPASNENPLGTSNDIAPIRLVQQAATNFVDAITSLIQHYVRSPTSIPTTSIAASNATSDSNTSIGSTSGLSVSTEQFYSLFGTGIMLIFSIVISFASLLTFVKLRPQYTSYAFNEVLL